MKLKDKIALVTGAGRGIGKAIALTMASEGASVILTARTLRELEGVRQTIEAGGKGSVDYSGSHEGRRC